MFHARCPGLSLSRDAFIIIIIIIIIIVVIIIIIIIVVVVVIKDYIPQSNRYSLYRKPCNTPLPWEWPINVTFHQLLLSLYRSGQ